MASNYHLLINIKENNITISIVLQNNYNQTREFQASFRQFVLLVTLLDAYTAFHCVRAVLSSNFLWELFLFKFDIFQFILFLHTYFHDYFIGTTHDTQSFTFTQ